MHPPGGNLRHVILMILPPLAPVNFAGTGSLTLMVLSVSPSMATAWPSLRGAFKRPRAQQLEATSLATSRAAS